MDINPFNNLNDSIADYPDINDNIGLYDNSSFVIMNQYLNKYVEKYSNNKVQEQIFNINLNNYFLFEINYKNNFINKLEEV